jgi:hypothetical protein
MIYTEEQIVINKWMGVQMNNRQLRINWQKVDQMPYRVLARLGRMENAGLLINQFLEYRRLFRIVLLEHEKCNTELVDMNGNPMDTSRTPRLEDWMGSHWGIFLAFLE